LVTVFSADRWVQAFLNCAGDDAGAGAAALQAMVAGIGTTECAGEVDAARLELAIRTALKSAGAAADHGAEIACRTIILLVRKHLFAYCSDLLAALKKELDRMNGIVTVIVDSAAPVEPALQADMRRHLIEKMKAHDVVLTMRVIPEILGGYRLSIASETFDASLQSLVADMTHHIAGTGGILC
jgi:F0F1-type ATP synthase delta subunit